MAGALRRHAAFQNLLLTLYNNGTDDKGGDTHDYVSLKEGKIMRGYRLLQANRIARRIFNNPTYWAAKYIEPQDYKYVLGVLRKTRKRCSCWMCGNRRQYEGLTFQELRQIEK